MANKIHCHLFLLSISCWIMKQIFDYLNNSTGINNILHSNSIERNLFFVVCCMMVAPHPPLTAACLWSPGPSADTRPPCARSRPAEASGTSARPWGTPRPRAAPRPRSRSRPAETGRAAGGRTGPAPGPASPAARVCERCRSPDSGGASFSARVYRRTAPEIRPPSSPV